MADAAHPTADAISDHLPQAQPAHGPVGVRDPLAVLILGAIGIVFGDIGTSPLYAIKETFAGAHPLPLDKAHIYGVLSLVFWSLTIIVSLKYTLLMMRIDNRGEGGSLALLAMVTRLVRGSKYAVVVTALGIFAAALFYGDSMLTPAISVLSAVEGLQVLSEPLAAYIIPITVSILIFLFMIQSVGTSKIGFLFGPIIVAWFAALAAVGIMNIAAMPNVLAALNPIYALNFFILDGWIAFLAMGSVVLAVTGAEALYADMGHFGAKSIRLGWFWLVFPALMLNYLGQGALLLTTPDAIENPFYKAVPAWGLIPMIALATMATVIASQAVISGAFSITRQAIQLGFLPRLQTIHTSAREQGQIYMPFVNWALLASVLALVLGFKSSSNLAAAYGVAVTGTMTITTLLFAVVVFKVWKSNLIGRLLLVALLLTIDFIFLAATATKITHGGWFPLAVGLVAFTLLMTWKRGRSLLMRCMADESLPVETFLNSLSAKVTRVPGTAVFLTGNAKGIPHALLHNLKHNKVIHERVVFLTVLIEDVPHVPVSGRLEMQHLGRRFYRVLLRFGYMDETDVPSALKGAAALGLEPQEMETSYFLGRETLIPSARPGMALWRESLFAWMTRTATSAMDYFKLPPNRVVELGTQVEI
ncbi:MAG: potassium transporter Kup [Rhodospirillaceae bacterium]|nr:potassium transporter Kup [Rhodospirillaceae bacterium]